MNSWISGIYISEYISVVVGLHNVTLTDILHELILCEKKKIIILNLRVINGREFI